MIREMVVMMVMMTMMAVMMVMMMAMMMVMTSSIFVSSPLLTFLTQPL